MTIYLEAEHKSKIQLTFADPCFLQLFLQKLYNEISLLKDKEHSYFHVDLYGVNIFFIDGVNQRALGGPQASIQEIEDGHYSVFVLGKAVPLRSKNRAFVTEVIRAIYETNAPAFIQDELNRLCMLMGIRTTEITKAGAKQAKAGSLLNKLKRL